MVKTRDLLDFLERNNFSKLENFKIGNVTLWKKLRNKVDNLEFVLKNKISTLMLTI